MRLMMGMDWEVHEIFCYNRREFSTKADYLLKEIKFRVPTGI